MDAGADVLNTYCPYAGMREVRIGKHRVRLYDSIDDLPMERFHRYNKMLLIDAGLGSDISAMDAHVEKVVRFMRGGDIDSAAKDEIPSTKGVL